MPHLIKLNYDLALCGGFFVGFECKIFLSSVEWLGVLLLVCVQWCLWVSNNVGGVVVFCVVFVFCLCVLVFAVLCLWCCLLWLEPVFT